MRTLKAVAATLALVATNSTWAGVVVVGTHSNIGTLDTSGVQRIFLGHGPSVEGQPIVVLYHTADDQRTEFENKVLGKTGSSLQAYWSQLVFTGRAAPFVEVNGDHGVKDKVNENPNAIGYINDREVDSTVKVLYKY
jgi:ABC-type phosphate transport system substrate-binding protein